MNLMIQFLILIELFLILRGLGMVFYTAKDGGSFHFVLAVTTCCCSGSFEELEVPSFGLVVSGVEADVINAKQFCKTYNETCC